MEKDKKIILRLYNALKRISKYELPERLQRQAEKEYGLSYEEVLEMAYDNVLIEAKNALIGTRKPKIDLLAKE